jgi:hypothetical protein
MSELLRVTPVPHAEVFGQSLHVVSGEDPFVTKPLVRLRDGSAAEGVTDPVRPDTQQPGDILQAKTFLHVNLLRYVEFTLSFS